MKSKNFTVMGPGPGNGSVQSATSYAKAFAQHEASEAFMPNTKDWQMEFERALKETTHHHSFVKKGHMIFGSYDVKLLS